MSAIPVERLPDAVAVARRAADLVAEAVRARPDATLVLPAGRTPLALYAELVRRARAGELDLSPAHLFQLDELVGVAPSDPRGFHALLARELVEPLGLGARFHGLDGAAADPAREIERHRRELAARGAPELALLGLGRNGHVAFNEPGASARDAARVVALAPTTLQGLRGAFDGAPPTRGMTLGLAEILAAREVAILVTGESKIEPLRRLSAGARGTELPAAWLREHPRVRVLADEAALGAPAASGA